MIVARGMPAFFAWAVYIGEVIAPLLLIFGFYTRLGGLLITLNMLVAIVLAHASHVFQMTGRGGLRLAVHFMFLRSEDSRVVNEVVSTIRSQGWRYNKHKK